MDLPRLTPDVRFTPFEEVSGKGRYLVEAGAVSFAVSWDLCELLRALAEAPSDIEDLAERYRNRTGRAVAPSVLRDLLEHHLPRALFDRPAPSKRKTPFVVSGTLLSPRVAMAVSRRLTWLYTPLVVACVLAGCAVALGASLPAAMESIQSPPTGLEAVVFYLALVAFGLFHELGHAAACQRYGCPHGPIGAGLYLIFPAFYTDVTPAWRLPPKARAVVDLGGIYFQCLIAILLAGWARASGSRLALCLLWLTVFTMLSALNPVFKMDGYWLFSDLTGLSNLHRRMMEALVEAPRGLLRFVRRAPAERPTDRRSLFLALYVGIVVSYAAFVAHLLLGSIRGLGSRAAEIAAAWHGAVAAVASGAPLAPALGTLLRLSAWPLVVAGILIHAGSKFVLAAKSARDGGASEARP